MKLSTNFVKEYIDIDVETQVLADAMTKVGNEYCSVKSLVSATKLITGRVIECVNHPDSNHLKVCKVDIGKEVLNIVCGAANVKADINVIVAQIGSKLSDFEIKKTVIRGVESNGMICSLEELGLDQKYINNEDKQGIHILSDNIKVGTDPIKELCLNDEVIDFELTSNRGDLLSILGMAYEIGAIYNKKIKEIDLSYKSIKDNICDVFKIDVQTSDCSVFLAKKVKDVNVCESPDYIKARLIASGIRPINNVIDISNYVMLETGQPLHFYDADKLNNFLIVRKGKEKEEVVTLDNIKRLIGSDDIVIANNNEVIGIAGVMGGFDTQITDETKNIIIEAAIFNPTKIRVTSKKILRSEASNRYEKGLDPKRVSIAIDRACNLLEKHADAKVLSGCIEHDLSNKNDKKIIVSLDKINSVLGFKLTSKQVLDIFERLELKVIEKENIFYVSVDTRRLDLSIQEDLIEEVGRIYGVDNIVGKLPTIPVKPGYINKTNRSIRRKMIALGFNETLTYTLISKEEVKRFTTDDFEEVSILDPMTEDRNTLRYSLIPSLFSVLKYNLSRNIKDLFLFEIGKGFYKKDNVYVEENKLCVMLTGNYFIDIIDNKPADYYLAKGILEEVMDYLGYEGRYELKKDSDIPKEFHPFQTSKIIINKNQIGIIGKAHPNILDDLFIIEINLEELFKNKTSNMKYEEISKYPSSVKDVAFVVEKTINSEDIEMQIKKSGGKLLNQIEVFDVYEGKNIKSYQRSIAYSLTFMDINKTLSEIEINTLFKKIIKDVKDKFSAEVRS